MSSPMVNGIYYSRMENELSFMWALVDGKDKYPAHFGGACGLLNVLDIFFEDGRWVYRKPDKSYMIMPEGMYKW